MLTDGNLSEFHGYTGDCGWVTALGAAYALDPAHYQLNARWLNAAVNVAIAHGWAQPQGQATIYGLNAFLTNWYGCSTKAYPYSDHFAADWRALLAEHAGQHPVILELRHGGQLHPANDPGLWYHFICQTNAETFLDGDHAAGTGEGTPNHYTPDELAGADVCGVIVVLATGPMRRAAQQPSAAKPRTITVKSGDTLAKLATALGLTSWYAQLYKPNLATIEAAARAHGRANSGMGSWIYPGTVLSY